MKIEEIYMRQEIRQMLNEAGITKNTLKDMVKEVLNEELDKACKQAMAEYNVEGSVQAYFEDNAGRALKNCLSSEVRQIMREKLDRVAMRISVDLTETQLL